MGEVRWWFATKSPEQLVGEGNASGLRRQLNGFDLIILGVGTILGTGIFVITGRAAAANAGPAVSLAFAIAGVAAALAALCYAEMVSMIPVSGSAYSYVYATLGELPAFMIGWNLLMAYAVTAALVGVGWSGYVTALFRDVLHMPLPETLTTSPLYWDSATSTLRWTGAYLNVPPVLLAALVSGLLARGLRRSARFNLVLVVLKATAVLLFIGCAAPFVRMANLTPFIPLNTGHFGDFGWSGVLQGSTMVYLAYIGFDAVSTAASETRNPHRDVPFGILGSLAVCTVLYVAVALVLTGVVPYKHLAVPHPMAVGVAAIGMGWLEIVVIGAAVLGLSANLMGMLVAWPRIAMAMARDGLLPLGVAVVHPRHGTPHRATWIVAGIVAVLGGMLPVDVLGELTSVGTLSAFAMVSLGVMVLRLRRPDLPRRFKVPGGAFLIPLSSATVCIGLMATGRGGTVIQWGAWALLGLGVYGLYGRRHSRLRAAHAQPELLRRAA